MGLIRTNARPSLKVFTPVFHVSRCSFGVGLKFVSGINIKRKMPNPKNNNPPMKIGKR